MKDALQDRKGFTFYRSYWDVINELSSEQAGELVKGIAEYQFTGKPPVFKGVLNAVWKGFETLVETQVNGYLSAKKTTTPPSPPKGGPHRPPQGDPSRVPPRTPASKEQRVKSKEKREKNNTNKNNIYLNPPDKNPFSNRVEELNASEKILTQQGLTEFINHWTEPDGEGKLRWQGQEFFNTKARMIKWANNNFSGKAKPKKIGERGAEFKNQVF